MKIVIFGAGGVGGYFGGRLAQGGQDVTFIARGAHLDAIRERGLRVDSVNGNFNIFPAQASDSPQAIVAADLILLCVKGWQLGDAVSQMQPLMGGETAILPLMNGMEHMDILLETFGAEHVLGGLCRISAFIEAPGHIRHVGIQPYLAFGEWDGSVSQRIQKLDVIFKPLEGVTAENPANIQTAMWEKFIFIAATSGVGAVIRKPLGDCRSDPETRAMLTSALEETAAIARARKIPIADNFVEATMTRIDNLPAHTVPSMQKDIMEGRPSELDQQTGAVTRMGKAANVRTPTHERILSVLSPLEQKARSR
jgi:2-dehydropantoate 2-reductase